MRPAVRVAAGCAAALLLAVAAGVVDRHYRFFDMVIYHDAIRWWVGGGELYEYAAPVPERLGFTYPPVAAFLLLPVAAMPAVRAGWLSAAGGIVVLALVSGALTRTRWTVLAVALPLALATEPVRQTLGLGQVNLFLFGLVVADLVLHRGGSRWAGIGIGIATAVKITPALFIVFLLVTGQWRTARTAAATAGGLTAAGFVLAPAESLRYFGDLLWRTERVGRADAVANQSLAGLLARLGDTATAPALWWIVLSLLALAVGLARARRAHRDGDDVAALTLVGLTANLISPISWTHHLMFLPVAVLVLTGLAHRHRTARHGVAALTVYAVCVVAPIWLVPARLTGPPAVVLENAFTLLLIALVCALPWQPASGMPGVVRQGVDGRQAPGRPDPTAGPAGRAPLALVDDVAAGAGRAVSPAAVAANSDAVAITSAGATAD